MKLECGFMEGILDHTERVENNAKRYNETWKSTLEERDPEK